MHVPVTKEGADCLAHMTAAHQSLIQTIKHLETYFSLTNVVLNEDSTDRHCLSELALGRVSQTL
jgi:hypothetical protein